MSLIAVPESLAKPLQLRGLCRHFLVRYPRGLAEAQPAGVSPGCPTACHARGHRHAFAPLDEREACGGHRARPRPSGRTFCAPTSTADRPSSCSISTGILPTPCAPSTWKQDACGAANLTDSRDIVDDTDLIVGVHHARQVSCPLAAQPAPSQASSNPAHQDLDR